MTAARTHYHVIEPKVSGSRYSDIIFVDANITIPSTEDERVSRVASLPTKKVEETARNATMLVNRLFRCKTCNKVFASRDNCVRHFATHNYEENTDEEANVDDYVEQIDAHEVKSSDLSCDLCHKQLSTPGTLKRHKEQVHDTPKQRNVNSEFFERFEVRDDFIVCDSCPYRCLNLQRHRFIEHYRIHTGERPFICAVCGKSSRTKGMLKKHLNAVHNDIREFVCDTCGKRFTEKRYMEEHRRIHTGEKPYICDLCGKQFTHTASLFVHKKLHRNERQHLCVICGQGFNTSSVLRKHVRRHRGERNYRCDECGKAFIDSQMLKCHKTVHSEERPFECELCDSRFKLKKHLRQHERTHRK